MVTECDTWLNNHNNHNNHNNPNSDNHNHNGDNRNSGGGDDDDKGIRDGGRGFSAQTTPDVSFGP